MMQRALLIVALTAVLIVVVWSGCGATAPRVPLTEAWPPTAGDYEDVTERWTRRTELQTSYQQVLELSATFKSPEWRAAHASRDASFRGLEGEARNQRLAQAQAEMAGPYEFELMVTTWDRRENDLDRGARSVWKVRLVDETGKEIEPLEVLKDKRPAFTVRADYPRFGDFATAYIARFPREKPILGAGVRKVELRMSSPRGGVKLLWESP